MLALGREWVVVAAAVAGLVVLLWPSFSSMLEQWQTSTYGYGYLIAPVSIFLLWREREALAQVPMQQAIVPMLLALPVAGGWVVAVLLRVDVVHQLAAVSLLVLLVWSLVGTPVARLMLFPLGYLFLMVPLGDQLIPYLMDLTADATVWAVKASGVPVYQDGYTFSLPTGDFEVVEACSGVRFLMAAVAAGAAFAYVVFQSLWKRVLFLGACVVVGIFGNLLRAYSVVMIAHLSNMEYGRDHNTFGIILNGVILLVFFLLASRFGEEPARVSPSRGSIPVQQGSHPSARYLPAGAMAVLLVVTALTPPGVLAWVDRAGVDVGEAALGTEVQGWVAARDAAIDWEPSAPTARAQRVQHFVAEDSLQVGSAVDVSVATFAALGDKADQTSGLNRVYQDPWSLLAARVSGPGNSVRREAVIRAPGRGMRLVWWWYRVGDEWTTSAVEAEWLTLRALLGFEVPVREVVAISATFEADMAPAAATLTAFSRAAGLPAGR